MRPLEPPVRGGSLASECQSLPVDSRHMSNVGSYLNYIGSLLRFLQGISKGFYRVL